MKSTCLLLIVLVSFTFTRCTEQNQKEEPVPSENDTSVAYAGKAAHPFDTLRVIEVPYRDTVWLIDSKAFISYGKNIPDEYGFKEITKKISYATLEESKFKLEYRLNISPDFYSVVVAFMPNENEVYHYLVNATKKYKLIDIERISGDDAVEGFSYAYSLINKNQIERFDANGFETEDDSKTRFHIQADGKIEMN